jgi:serine/threonine protein phosphatase PrpC/DNA-binding transcriptional MerR regulator
VVDVKLLTIGEFARASRLSPKALRLYDELGLVRPLRVDEWSGYRYYAPDQLERAHLVAWLRRLGMPLAQIGAVVAAPPAEAAAAVSAFLRASEAEFTERQRLAQFLIAYLTEGATAMPDHVSPEPAYPAADAPGLAIRYAAASDIGRVRAKNQDAGYAGPSLAVVADGFGPAGERASAAAIQALRSLESPPPATASLTGTTAVPAPSPADVLNALSDAATAAAASVRAIAGTDPEFAGSGSTLTAVLLSGSRLALVHIGDTRAYLFRDGGLFQVTHDHTVTQAMIDAGTLTPEEAVSHPQRSMLMRALAAWPADVLAGMPLELAGAAQQPETALLDARPGDRYLITSDGLTSVVPAAVIRKALAETASAPDEVVARLVALANEAGGPDNIAIALADVIEAA